MLEGSLNEKKWSGTGFFFTFDNNGRVLLEDALKQGMQKAFEAAQSLGPGERENSQAVFKSIAKEQKTLMQRAVDKAQESVQVSCLTGGNVFVVTNKHVVMVPYGAEKRTTYATAIRLNVHARNDDGTPSRSIVRLEIDPSVAAHLLLHPDLNTDLCMLPLAKFTRADSNPFYLKCFNPDIVATAKDLAKMTVDEQVIMPGFPNGLIDRHNNLPLSRHGHTAFHAKLDFNVFDGGEPYGVVDMACFGGSSGSPVVWVKSKPKIEPKVVGPGLVKFEINMKPKVKLLGILCSGPLAPIRIGETATTDTMVQEDLVTGGVMMHMGYYIKVQRIMEMAGMARTLAAEANLLS